MRLFLVKCLIGLLTCVLVPLIMFADKVTDWELTLKRKKWNK